VQDGWTEAWMDGAADACEDSRGCSRPEPDRVVVPGMCRQSDVYQDPGGPSSWDSAILAADQ
jgi:hypothetical protein